jgi:hypothetical protein
MLPIAGQFLKYSTPTGCPLARESVAGPALARESVLASSTNLAWFVPGEQSHRGPMWFAEPGCGQPGSAARRARINPNAYSFLRLASPAQNARGWHGRPIARAIRVLMNTSQVFTPAALRR